MSVSLRRVFLAAIFAAFIPTTAAATTPSPGFQLQLERALQADETMVVACLVGEEAQVDAKGLSRVSIDDSSMLAVRPADDKFTISCDKVGTTHLALVQRGEFRTVIVRVGELYTGEPATATCTMPVRVVLGASGLVQQVIHLDGEAEKCLTALKRGIWSPADSRKQFIRVFDFKI